MFQFYSNFGPEFLARPQVTFYFERGEFTNYPENILINPHLTWVDYTLINVKKMSFIMEYPMYLCIMAISLFPETKLVIFL